MTIQRQQQQHNYQGGRNKDALASTKKVSRKALRKAKRLQRKMNKQKQKQTMKPTMKHQTMKKGGQVGTTQCDALLQECEGKDGGSTRINDSNKDKHAKEDDVDRGSDWYYGGQANQFQKKTKRKAHLPDATSLEGEESSTWIPNSASEMTARMAIQAEEDEIQQLEQKLQLSNPSKKKRLYQEYALEGYGQDFGDFLDGLDDIIVGCNDDDDTSRNADAYPSDMAIEKQESGVKDHGGIFSASEEEEQDDEDDDDEGEEEQLVPMKNGTMNSSDSSSTSSHGDDCNDQYPQKRRSTEEGKDDDQQQTMTNNDTYTPCVGEDIYGRLLNNPTTQLSKPGMYIPPHLRHVNNNDNMSGGRSSSNNNKDDITATEQHLISIRRLLNRQLNRLAETGSIMESVTKELAFLYHNNNGNSITKTTTTTNKKYSTHDINQCLYEHIYATCINNSNLNNVIMTFLIPIYSATVAATIAYMNTNATISFSSRNGGNGGGGGCSNAMVEIGGYLIERLTKCFVSSQQLAREVCIQKIKTKNLTDVNGGHGNDTEDITVVANVSNQNNSENNNENQTEYSANSKKSNNSDKMNNDSNESYFLYGKQSTNAVLLLCYFYIYGIIHCTFIYNVIRDLIDNFTEVDIEVLLIILQHAGYQLRNDDPSSLKDIKLLVRQRSCAQSTASTTTTMDNNNTRVQHMISAITDLKNNKRRKKDDSVILDRITAHRKFIGRMKTLTNRKNTSIGGSSNSSSSPDTSCLRVTMQDILDIETKGRWWKVGASWKGNQFVVHDNAVDSTAESMNAVQKECTTSAHNKGHEDDELLRLATKMRINSDLRRSIFCVLMGSTDCEDAFEKLVKLGLKGQQDREIVRVLMDCCGQERSYNPYYSHLALRLCELHRNYKFTFQRTYWDMFQQFDSMKSRRAANLAKLFLHLLKGRALSLTTLKVLDVTDLPESGMIFLTMIFTVMLSTYSKKQVVEVFGVGIPNDNDGLALRENLSVFLLQYIKKSPKNVKKSGFNINFRAAVKVCESESLTDASAIV